MKAETINQIASDFLNELASRYDLPEIRGSKFIEGVYKDSEGRQVKTLATEQVFVFPRGQFSAVIKRLWVKVEVSFQEKLVRGKIHYSYAHFGGGSNGCGQDFTLIIDGRYEEDWSYAGMVNDQFAYKIFSETLYAEREHVAKTQGKAAQYRHQRR